MSLHPSFVPARTSPLQLEVLVALCDWNGFARYCQGRTSADIFAELNAFYLRTDQTVEAAGGLVIKFMGDAVLVVFPRELAGQGILTLVDYKKTTDAHFREGQIACTFHVNCHFGEVTMGKMGHIERLDVIGDTVNRLAAMPCKTFGLTREAFAQLSAEQQRIFQPYAPPLFHLPEQYFA